MLEEKATGVERRRTGRVEEGGTESRRRADEPDTATGERGEAGERKRKEPELPAISSSSSTSGGSRCPCMDPPHWNNPNLPDIHGQYCNLLSGQGVPQGWMSSEPFNPFAPITGNESNMPVGGSSQMEGDPEEDPHVPVGQIDEVMSKKGGRKKNFSEKEDVLLCLAWGNVGMDPIVGTNQSTASYWQRIYEYYHEHKNFSTDRNQKSLTARWQSIQEHVSKFSGCLAQVERRNQSGTNNEDKKAEAAMLYQSHEKKKFMYMHCYIVLHHHPKWTSSFSSKKQKSSTTASPGASPAGGIYLDLDGDIPDLSGKGTARPMGTKAAKSQRRRSMSSDRESAMKASTDSINSQIMENENKRQDMLKQHQKDHEKGLHDRHEQHLAMKNKKIEMIKQIEERKMEQKERLKLIEIEAEDRRRRNDKTMELEARELDMIMQLDYSKLNAESKEYYEKRKKKLLAKKELMD